MQYKPTPSWWRYVHPTKHYWPFKGKGLKKVDINKLIYYKSVQNCFVKMTGNYTYIYDIRYFKYKQFFT